jgi:phosphinothricin acetyltransferase
MNDSDSQVVLKIYRKGLETRNATFETILPSWKDWEQTHHNFCRLVFVNSGSVVGWTALSPFSARTCYSGVAEISIYVDPEHAGKGIGHALMAHLIRESEKNGIWTIQASVFPENHATLQLHLKHGFREVGLRERVAKLDGQWRSTLILERRSNVVGSYTEDHN